VRQDLAPVQVSRVSPLFRFLRVLRERWWVVAATTLACTAAALAVSLPQPKEYEASSSLLFRNPGFSTALFGSSVFEPSLDPARESTTNLQLLQSREVARAVADELGLDTDPDDLLDQVEAEERTNSDVVDVKVRDEDPELAARLADQFATQYVLFRQESDRRKITEAQQLIQSRLDSLAPDAVAERDQLEDALQRLVALEAVQTGNAEVVERAEVPQVAASLQTRRDVGVALIFGLGLGLLIAMLLDVLDRRVKSPEEFEELYRVPNLVTVPQATFGARRRADGGAAFEPFRILFSSLGFLSVAGPMRKVLVTSAIAEEGKTSVAVNLARAVALSGRSVALIEADLRRPSFRRHLVSEPSPTGLTNALVSRQSALELIRYMHPEDLDDGYEAETAGPGADVRGLVGVLQSGPVPPNSAELLRSERMAELLDEVAERHEYVIVDAPPLLPVADAQVLLGHGFVDVCLIVGRVYKTKRDQARRARAILDQANLERVGLVVSGVRGSPGGYEYYSRTESPAVGPEPTRR
jgi:polysaccharide biosynthesis transport protein